jgi:protein O-GlcNAc transferase
MNSLQQIMQGALQAHQAGKFDAAIQGYRMALSLQPEHPEIMNHWGVAELQRGNLSEARRLMEASLRRAPQQPDVLCNLAYVLNQLGEHASAVEACDRSLALERPNASALTNKGEALRRLGRAEDALASFEAALAAHPDRADYLYNRANALFDLHRIADAIRDFNAALQRAPQVRQIRINLAAAHVRHNEFPQAVTHLEEAGRMDPSDPLVWMNLGAVHDALRDPTRAEQCFRRVIELQPGNALGHANLAQLLLGTHRYTEAIDHFSEALRLDQTLHRCLGGRLMARRHLCDLQGEEEEQLLIKTALVDGHAAMTPFEAIVTQDDPAVLLRATQNFVAHRLGTSATAVTQPTAADSARKIRIGYFSADWGEHPVTYLMEPVLRAHDRDVLEVHVFLTGRQPPSPALDRVMRAADRFHDVVGLPVAEIQARAQATGIDIAVDLGGHTLNNRADLFVARTAPVQVSYLGYPGPSGIPAMDYIVADDTLIPGELRHHYTERVAWMDVYQASSDWPAITGETRRATYGLPDNAFVFCCFGNSFKISPLTLSLWSNILLQAPDSLLWISLDNPDARRNLVSRLEEAGVDATRIHFADRVARGAYLQRMALGDLYLDTTPSSSGTTAADALRVGLPILTLTGHTFSARMCTSILRSADMHQLAASSPEEYVARAVAFCQQPQSLRELRLNMSASLQTSRFSDTTRTARQLESLYRQMHRLRCAGSPWTDLRAG